MPHLIRPVDGQVRRTYAERIHQAHPAALARRAHDQVQLGRRDISGVRTRFVVLMSRHGSSSSTPLRRPNFNTSDSSAVSLFAFAGAPSTARPSKYL